MRCVHPECTGVHDNNRYSELCPRSRALKRIKDSRYVYNETVTEGFLTKGWVVRRHREFAAMYRRNLSELDSDGKYAELAGEAWATRHAGYWQQRLAQENEKFRVKREGYRGTRRKIDTICAGRNGVIPVTHVLAATRNPGLRTFYPRG